MEMVPVTPILTRLPLESVITVYHGSPKPVQGQFQIPSKGKNSTVLGEWDVSRWAAFFTDSREDAAEFAQKHGGAGHVQAYHLQLDQPLNLEQGFPEGVVERLVEEGFNYRWLTLSEPWELLDNDHDADGELAKALLRLGFDCIIFHENGLRGKIMRTFAVLDPSKISPALDKEPG